MARRIANLMCAHHRGTTLRERRWPVGLTLSDKEDLCSCQDCLVACRRAEPGWYATLPHLGQWWSDRCLVLHEAGHAVIHHLLGRQVNFAELGLDEVNQWDGWVNFQIGPPGTEFAQAVGNWAGMMAESVALEQVGLLDEDTRIDITRHGVSDADEILRLTGPEHVEDARVQAEALVHEHWFTIMRVADVLAVRRKLNSVQLGRLIGPRALAPSGV